jgi:peptidyl-prolyl cis-trans isomerase A (cyclophilin A)
MEAMSRPGQFITALCSLVALVALAQQPAVPGRTQAPQPASAATTVVLHTTLGDIRIALDTQRAPLTSKNFLQYVDAGRFDGIHFYRALKGSDDGREGLVQAGLQGNMRNAFPPIPHESTVTTGLSHVDGAVSMARGSGPGSARGDFFIVVGDMSVTYDGVPDGGDPGYAVFGRVVEGMPLVRRMLRMPRSGEARNERMQGQMLAEPVTILTARRAP